ncbi:penicillin-binding protein 1C [Thiohalocapsa marina]|uniref:peptidoglycan glycosyltransferase n=1 Tax=Thiohalocapsa marina TaxID=424902 RepID=A0A5M8FJI0_9GAMM|nr:penicillin-binding protein 1C [Thiohalocapsa marina]KAA6185063.1 penicillin-binding protein 1C [Thiohalocapsa marina]
MGSSIGSQGAAAARPVRWPWFLGGLVLLVAGLGLLMAQVAATPTPDLRIETSAEVVDRNGTLLRAFTVADGRWRLRVEPEAVDPLLLEMLLAFEDQRFFSHGGVDPRAIARAAWQALRHGRVVSGASTLSMQVARLRLGLSTRSLAGKWQQIRGALALERAADKDAILAAYLHLAPYGGNLEGVRAASLAWFGKEPVRLTPAQAALLVALPQSPRARRPDLSPDGARAGRARVLARAEAAGIIDADTAAAARREPLPTRRLAFPLHAAHAARRALEHAPSRGRHRLTIDAGLQARLERLAAEHAAALPDGTSVALMVADHGSGEVLASVGSAGLLDSGRDGFVDMTRALRSPGSTLKPLIYGLAFDQGLAHPQSLIEDRPDSFGDYAPTNFDRDFQGTVTVREALQASLNVPAITLLQAVGPARLLARLRRAGAEPQLAGHASPGLAIGLGGVGLTLHDLVALYAAIGRGGRALDLRERLDAPLAAPLASGNRPPVLSSRATWYLGSILSGSGDMRQVSDALAMKTGTSYGYRDAWALGYDGRHVIGVWAGRPDGAPVFGLTGRTAAVPLLRDAYARLGRRVPLPPPGRDVWLARTTDLPPTLRAVRPAAAADPASRLDGVEIAFPPDGARVDLGLRQGAGGELVLQARDGRPPLVWLANGRPIAQERFVRTARWRPDGPGYATISVIDADGRASRVRVHLE